MDENALAEGHDYFSLGVFEISSDQRVLAYATDLDGSEQYRMFFRELDAARDLPDEIENVHYGAAWAADNQMLFYVRVDEAMRPFQVWSHRLGTPVESDRLVFEEPDERFFVSVGRTRSERFIVIQSESKLSSEVRYLDASRAEEEPALVLARQQGVEYDVDHAEMPGEGDVWLLRTNAPGLDGQPATNFSLQVLPIGSSAVSKVLLAHRPETKLEGVDAFAEQVIVSERADGLERLRVLRLGDASEHLVEQPDPVYSLIGAANPEWDTTSYRFGYTSLVTPVSSIDYDIATKSRTVVKEQPVLGGYRAEDYVSERLWAHAPDGTAVPISLVRARRVSLDGSAPCVLYGYGSYEVNIDPTFSAARLNLLERGVIFAIAHVRGGGEMGRIWHEQGRLQAKPNTFTDFIACAEYLIEQRYTGPGRLVIRGGSAGGLLVGAVVNLRPELFAAVVAEVPFVDVVTTMSDETLPLTVTEWEEWGNPVADHEAYEVMAGYSPYDNVRPVDYPAMFVTAGLNDPRVGFWEPAKWVAKLRANTTGSKPILLRTEMGAGHGGSSGRYDAWWDEARVQAFILTSLGIDE